jgi:hypothetical protein
MTNERRNQRDLFEQATMPPELPSYLRAALTPLLRVLLTEAAAQGMQAETDDRIGEEDGDDQDHA